MFIVPRLYQQPPQHVREPHRRSIRSTPLDNVHVDGIGLEAVEGPTLRYNLSTNP